MAVHQDSRVLKRLPAVARAAHRRLARTSACKAFKPSLGAALDGNDELALMQALLDLIELPTRVLRRHCPGFWPKDTQQARSGQAAAAAAARGTPPAAHPDPPSFARKGDPRLRRATKLANRDLADLAMQEVLSNGCAPHARDPGHPARDAPTRHRRGWRRPSSLCAAGDGLPAPG